MRPVYEGKWTRYGDVKQDVSYGDNLPLAKEIVYAGYEDYGYSNGSALIVFVRDGQLFENNDSRCSCHGLDGWSPEPTTIEALRMRQGCSLLPKALKRFAALSCE